jgi:hypothetical protein
MANKHGGAREGAGRSSVSDEAKARNLSINALKKVFGSEEGAFEHAANMAADNKCRERFKYYELLIKYGYGAPKQEIDLMANIIRVSPINSPK